MRRVMAILAMCIVAAGATGLLAAGQQDLKMTRIFLVDGGWDKLGVEQTARIGDSLLWADIRFEQTAKVQQAALVSVHGLNLRVGPGDLLRLAYPANRGELALSAEAATYCTGRFELDERQRMAYPPGDIRRSTKYKKFEREVSICFLDDDGDGHFDRGFVNGAVSEDAKPAVPLRPMSYRTAQMEDPEGTRMEVRLVRSGNSGTPYLEVFTNIHRGQFAPSYVFFLAENGKMDDIDRTFRFRPANLPRTIMYQNAQLTLLSYDEATETLRYRIDKPFTKAMIKIQAIFYPQYNLVTNYSYE